MAKDLARELVKAINEVYEVKVELVKKEPALANRLLSALERLNKIAAFYKIQ